MFTAFVTAQVETQMLNWWMDKMRASHTMECYSVIKRSGILPSVTTYMDLEGVNAQQNKSTEKDGYCMILLLCVIYKPKNQAHWYREQTGEGKGGQKVQTSSYKS